MTGLTTSGLHPAKGSVSGHAKQQGLRWTTPAGPRGEQGSASANSMTLAASPPLHTAKHCREALCTWPRHLPPDGGQGGSVPTLLYTPLLGTTSEGR